jgi:ABC-type lipoprotein export system ATPase subunit
MKNKYQQFGNGDLEAGHCTQDPAPPPLTSPPVPVSHPPTESPMSIWGMLCTLFAMLGKKLACILAFTLFVIPIATAFSRLETMKVVTGHGDFIPLIVLHFAYTLCTGVFTNVVSTRYAEFITHIICARLRSTCKLYLKPIPHRYDDDYEWISLGKMSIKKLISAIISIVLLTITMFITVLDTQNIYCIIIPLVNIVSVYMVRRLTKKDDDNVLPVIAKDCKSMTGDWCNSCNGLCFRQCEIIADFKKSVWMLTLLVSVTWIPDIICMGVFSYTETTSAVIISWMYISWMLRTTITSMYEVLDDKANPICLVQRCLKWFSLFSQEQAPLNIDGRVLENVKRVIVTDYESRYGKFSITFPRGSTIGAENNGSGKTTLLSALLFGICSALSVELDNGEIRQLNEFSLKSKLDYAKLFNKNSKLPLDCYGLYKRHEELAEKLGISEDMAKSTCRSDGENSLFIILDALSSHSQSGQGILLLDEVTRNLDTNNYIKVENAIRKYSEERRLITIMIVNNKHNKPDFSLPGPPVSSVSPVSSVTE